jgi:hypothetical protein
MWVRDPRYDERAPSRPGWERGLDAAVAAYRASPALAGYFVTDEPSAEQFDAVQAVVSRLRAADPDRIAYINLNPDYVFGAAADRVYPVYIQQFLSSVRPAILSYDHYPFLVDADRPTFFRSLALIRDRAEQSGVPFLLIIQAMPHADYRDPTEAELSWQAYHAVAYGASGISYFAYWTPVNVAYQEVMRFRHGLIENGAPTNHYREAATLNGRLRAIASELSGFKSVAVRDSAGAVAPALPFGPIREITGGNVTVGFFEGPDDRNSMAMLVNRDYRRRRDVTLRVEEQSGRPEVFDVDTRRWSPIRGERLQLTPGGALLLKFVRAR